MRTLRSHCSLCIRVNLCNGCNGHVAEARLGAAIPEPFFSCSSTPSDGPMSTDEPVAPLDDAPARDESPVPPLGDTSMPAASSPQSDDEDAPAPTGVMRPDEEQAAADEPAVPDDESGADHDVPMAEEEVAEDEPAEEEVAADEEEASVASREAAEAAEEEAAPEELNAEQALELISRVEELRKKRSNSSFTLHGWRMTWIFRPSSDHGDMTVYDPADGSKIHSVVGLKRRLGIEIPPPVPKPAPVPPRASNGEPTAEGEGGGEEGERPNDLTEQQVEARATRH